MPNPGKPPKPKGPEELEDDPGSSEPIPCPVPPPPPPPPPPRRGLWSELRGAALGMPGGGGGGGGGGCGSCPCRSEYAPRNMRLSPATEVADTGDVRLADVRVDSTVRGRPVNSLEPPLLIVRPSSASPVTEGVFRTSEPAWMWSMPRVGDSITDARCMRMGGSPAAFMGMGGDWDAVGDIRMGGRAGPTPMLPCCGDMRAWPGTTTGMPCMDRAEMGGEPAGGRAGGGGGGGPPMYGPADMPVRTLMGPPGMRMGGEDTGVGPLRPTPVCTYGPAGECMCMPPWCTP